MVARCLSVAVMCMLIHPPAWGDDVSLETEEGQRQVGDNISAIARQMGSLRWSYAKLINMYQLTEELELTDKQLESLEEVGFLDPGHLYAEITPQNPLTFSAEQMKEFLPKLMKRCAEQRQSEDARIADALSTPQLTRLRQIGTQLYLTVYNNPAAALEFHGKTLATRQLRAIRAEIGRQRRAAYDDAVLLWYREKLLAIRDIVGGDELDERIGRLHTFGRRLEGEAKDEFSAGFPNKKGSAAGKVPTGPVPFQLYLNPAVCDELTLTSEQQADMTPLIVEWHKNRSRDNPIDIFGQNLQDPVEVKLSKQMHALLSGPQQRRLSELRTQYAIRAAGSAAEVAATGFAMTDDELELLDSVLGLLEAKFDRQSVRLLAPCKDILKNYMDEDEIERMIGEPFDFEGNRTPGSPRRQGVQPGGQDPARSEKAKSPSRNPRRER